MKNKSRDNKYKQTEKMVETRAEENRRAEKSRRGKVGMLQSSILA